MGTGSRYFYMSTLCLVIFMVVIVWRRNNLLESFAVQQQPVLSWTKLAYNDTTGGTGKPVRVSIGSDNTVACLNDSDAIMKIVGSQWKMIPGTLNEIHLKDVNNIVGVARDFAIYQTINANAAAASVSWTKLTASRFDNVSLGWDGSVWANYSAHRRYMGGVQIRFQHKSLDQTAGLDQTGFRIKCFDRLGNRPSRNDLEMDRSTVESATGTVFEDIGRDRWDGLGDGYRRGYLSSEYRYEHMASSEWDVFRF